MVALLCLRLDVDPASYLYWRHRTEFSFWVLCLRDAFSGVVTTWGVWLFIGVSGLWYCSFIPAFLIPAAPPSVVPWVLDSAWISCFLCCYFSSTLCLYITPPPVFHTHHWITVSSNSCLSQLQLREKFQTWPLALSSLAYSATFLEDWMHNTWSGGCIVGTLALTVDPCCW